MKYKAPIILLLLLQSVMAQHFIPVEPTGLPYQVIVTKITVNGNIPVYGTEIGIFDDSLCVGSAEFTSEENLPITAWEESSSFNLPGFKVGNSIYFKIWTQIGNDWQELIAVPQFIEGSGLFGSGLFSIVELTANITTSVEMNNNSAIKVDIYPNPSYKNVNLNFAFEANGEYSIEIFNLIGEKVYTIEKSSSEKVNKSFIWNGETLSGKNLTAGIYIIAVNTPRQTLTKKFLFVK